MNSCYSLTISLRLLAIAESSRCEFIIGGSSTHHLQETMSERLRHKAESMKPRRPNRLDEGSRRSSPRKAPYARLLMQP